MAAVVTGAACSARAPEPAPAPAPDPGREEPAPPAAGEGDPPEPAEARPGAREALRALEETLEAGRPLRAALRADSLYFSLVSSRPAAPAPSDAPPAADALRLVARSLAAAGRPRQAAARYEELLARYPRAPHAPAAARGLAELRRSFLDDPGSARALLEHGGTERADLELLRAACRAMSVEELGALAGEHGAAGPAAGVVRAELAVALARSGAAARARRVARTALEGEVAAPDARRARRVLEGGVVPAEGPIRIGAILPTSGRFGQVGEWLRQGMEIALERSPRPTGRGVELVALDAAAEASVPALLDSLHRRGAVAVIGPVRSEALARAAGDPATDGRLLVSPTASRRPGGFTGAYTLWDRERREVGPARVLGRWLARRAEVGRTGVLYPEGELGRRAYLAFLQGVSTAGSYVAAAAPYPPGATTFRRPISTVAGFGPRAVFVVGTSSTSVLQIAPQLSYFGVRGAVVGGGPTWAQPATVRRLTPSILQLRVVAGFAPPTAGEGAREAFKAMYEEKYRRVLSNNVLPMLGHDAMKLVLASLPRGPHARPRAVARRFAGLGRVEGATGRLSPDPATGTVRRQVRVSTIRDRELAAVTPEAVQEWLAGAGRLAEVERRQRRRRALKAVEDAEIELRPGDGTEDGAGAGREDVPR